MIDSQKAPLYKKPVAISNQYTGNFAEPETACDEGNRCSSGKVVLPIIIDAVPTVHEDCAQIQKLPRAVRNIQPYNRSPDRQTTPEAISESVQETGSSFDSRVTIENRPRRTTKPVQRYDAQTGGLCNG